MYPKRLCATLVAAAIILTSTAALAQQDGGRGPEKKGPHGKRSQADRKSRTDQGTKGMPAPMMRQMKRMMKLKEALAEARGAAEAEGAKTTLKKVSKAEKLLEKQMMAMHKKMMARHMGMKKDGMRGPESKKSQGKTMQGPKQGMKCPMCRRMMDKQRARKMKCPMCGRKMSGEGGKMTARHGREMMDKHPRDEARKKEGDWKVVNPRCPMKGRKLDRDDIPKRLTREWKGRRIGFCCEGCPKAWDKLSADRKERKLKKAMAAPHRRRDGDSRREERGRRRGRSH